MKKASFQNLATLLTDEFLDVREAAGWALVRLSIDRDGVNLQCQNEMPLAMINSFHKYTDLKSFKQDNCKFLIYLLESFFYILKYAPYFSFTNFTSYDNGITFFLGKEMIRKLKDIAE